MQGLDQFSELFSGLFTFLQPVLNLVIFKIGRDYIEIVELGMMDEFCKRGFTLDEPLAHALEPGLLPKIPARGTLWVQVPEQSWDIGLRGNVRKIHAGGCFSDTALEIVYG